MLGRNHLNTMHSQFPCSISNISRPCTMEDFDMIMSLITPKNVANRRVVDALLNDIDAIERVAIAKALILQDEQQKQQAKTRKPRSI